MADDVRHAPCGTTMSRMAHLVKHWLIPGSMPLLFVGVVTGAIGLAAGPPLQDAGAVWLGFLALLYWLLSLPVVSHALIAGLGERYGTVDASGAERGARVLVAIGNGSVHYTDRRREVDYLTRRSVYCVFETARVYELLRPELIVVTGGAAGDPAATPEGELMRTMLLGFGLPPDLVVAETRSRTTAQQVTNVLRIVEARGIGGPLIVVTTTAHMSRVAALFKASGAAILPSITRELQYGEGLTGWRRWWPSMPALVGSASAMYEYLANAEQSVRSRPR